MAERQEMRRCAFDLRLPIRLNFFFDPNIPYPLIVSPYVSSAPHDSLILILCNNSMNFGLSFAYIIPIFKVLHL